MSRNVSGGDSGSMSWTRPRRLAASSRKRSSRSPPSPAPAGEATASTRKLPTSARNHEPGIGLWYNSRVRSPAVPVLDRYVVRELISPLLLGGGVCTLFLVTDRIYQ